MKEFDADSLAALATEACNPASERLDELSTVEMLGVMHAADREVADAIAAEIPHIATAVDAIAERIAKGGRLFYIGAGTSGRLGVLDASECPPTFGVAPDLVQGIMAGGDAALRTSVEGAEDDASRGASDLMAAGFSKKDSLVGIAASGRTPYVVGAIEYAYLLGALTIGLSCVPNSAIGAGGRDCHLAGDWRRGAHRLDTTQGGNGDQAGSQYAQHRCDGPHRVCLRQPDGERAADQCQAD